MEPLSGSFKGAFNDGKIDGEWTQPVSTTELSLISYVEALLPRESQDFLMGQWHGKLVIPGGEFNIIFHFETDESEGVVGFTQNVDAGAEKQSLADLMFEDGELFFERHKSMLNAKEKWKAIALWAAALIH